MPNHKNPCPENNNFFSSNFGRPFRVHHNYALSLFESCPRVYKKILKEIMHSLYFTDNLPCPRIRNPAPGVMKF